MNILDIRTLFINHLVINAICVVVMIFLWVQNRRQFPAISFWLANFILQFLAIVLITLRGVVPDFLSIIVANTLGVTGTILLYAGMQHFIGRPGSQRHNYTLLLIFFTIHLYFTYLQPSLLLRTINFSAAILVICIRIARLTVYRDKAGAWSDTSKVGVTFVVIGLIHLVRILIDLSFPTANDLFQSGLFEALVILTYPILSVCVTFILFLLVNQRLVAELEQDLLERRQMEIALKQRLIELEIVGNLSTSLRAGQNLKELLQILLKEVLKAVHGTIDGCIFLTNPESGAIKMTECSGRFEAVPELCLDVNEGFVRQIFTNTEPYFSQDLQSDGLISKQIPCLGTFRSSGVFLPIRGENNTLGMLIITFQSARIISENELRLLKIISQLAANAISRSRLHDQVKISNIDLQKEIRQKAVVQELLAAEKELLTTTLMSIADGVVATDKDGFVFLFNQAAETITGYSFAEALDKPIREVFRLQSVNSLEPFPEVIEHLLKLEEAEKHHLEYRSPLIIAKTGEKILLSGSITPLKATNEQTVGFVIVFRNINEKQKAEAQNILSKKMEAIGQLAAGIAHEINTPIQYVGDNIKFFEKAYSKYSELLTIYQKIVQEHLEKNITQAELDQLSELTRQKKVSYYATEIPRAIEEALDGTERVRKIVLAMREFSHPSEKEKKFADINHGIETTVAISRNEWKYCAELETALADELPLVFCQIDEINQVILNMIINAAQAIQAKLPDGAEQKGKIWIGTRHQADKVYITIADTGEGIPPEIRERIFDPFFTTKGVGKGTGQGLSMAHNIIVKKHQGMISVESTPGQGTTFTIELPIGYSEPEQP